MTLLLSWKQGSEGAHFSSDVHQENQVESDYIKNVGTRWKLFRIEQSKQIMEFVVISSFNFEPSMLYSIGCFAPETNEYLV